jgi:DNA-binding NtrC family response regulator
MRILIIGRPDALLHELANLLGGHGAIVEACDEVADVFARPAAARRPDLLLCPLGQDLAAAVLAVERSGVPVPIVAYGRRDACLDSTSAIGLGASGTLKLPATPRQVALLLRRAGPSRTARPLVAHDPAMLALLRRIELVASSNATVLITGESGSGKGALARWIHDHGARASGPFVHVNCAALPSGLVEAELFGVRRGAFTDARESRDGLFVEASGGTIFLDEIADMPLEIQSKLLGVLESARVRPVGGGDAAIDARVIAATNRAIDDAVQSNQFRLDLFFRLNVIRIEMPPLRERLGDIPELVNALLARASRDGAGPIGITDDAMRWLARHDWPGNVRELANVVERAVALTDHDTIVLEDVRDLETRVAADPTGELMASAAARQLPLAEVERTYIRRVLDANDGNVSRAARILGIDRRTLYRKLA